MTNESEILSEADEIAAMLPWYVSGRIGEADRAKVEAYAKGHPEVYSQIALAREEADAIFAENQEIAPPKNGLDKLRARLAASPSARLSAAKASVIDRLGEMLAALAPRQLAYGALTAALALAVLAASAGSLLMGRPGTGGYETATGPKAAADKGTFALVAFQPAAPTGTLSAFLAENKLTIVEGPKAGGIFVVRVSEEALSQEALAAQLTKLKSRSDLISFASAAPSR